jgi:hypothetical protein
MPLRERMVMPETALAIATGDAAAREWAWKRIDAGSVRRTNAAELSTMEPSARRRG